MGLALELNGAVGWSVRVTVVVVAGSVAAVAVVVGVCGTVPMVVVAGSTVAGGPVVEVGAAGAELEGGDVAGLVVTDEVAGLAARRVDAGAARSSSAVPHAAARRARTMTIFRTPPVWCTRSYAGVTEKVTPWSTVTLAAALGSATPIPQSPSGCPSAATKSMVWAPPSRHDADTVSGDAEHLGPALGQRRGISAAHGKAGDAAGLDHGGDGGLPLGAAVAPRPRRPGLVQRHDRPGDVLGVEVDVGDVGMLAVEDDADPEVGEALAGRLDLGELTHHHVPAVAADPVAVAARGGAVADRASRPRRSSRRR